MFRRYLLTGLVGGFLGIGSTLYAGESEIILKDNTTASGLTVKEETASTTIARFRGDGKVGIGTASPETPLQIGSEGTYWTTSNIPVALAIGGQSAIGWDGPGSGVGTRAIYGYNQNLYFSRSADTDIDATANAVTHDMVITSGGNVGIGTTNPGYKLDMTGNARLEQGSGAYIRFTESSAEHGYIGGASPLFVGSAADFGIRAENNLIFGISSSEKMRIANNGNVGIGTASPQHPLHMGSGAHVTTGGVWTNASSREYKENIRDLTVDEAMQTLDGLRPSRFNYKVGDEDEYVGFIAEDVPELVATRDRKGLSPMDLTAVLTKVVQEQQRMLQAQQEAMNKLKQEIKMLKSAVNYGVKGL